MPSSLKEASVEKVKGNSEGEKTMEKEEGAAQERRSKVTPERQCVREDEHI